MKAARGRRPWWSRCLAGLGLAVALAGHAAAGGFHARELPDAAEQPFRLHDAHGALRTSTEFRGRVVLLFFGFTHCPDVCPTELARLAEAIDLLPPDQARQVEVAFITLDPQRDSPQLLRSYVAAFSPDFIALRGSEEETAALAKAFRVFYRRVAGSAPGRYTLEHSAYVHVLDKRGRLRLRIPGSLAIEQVAEDLRRLLAE
ncbi:MAG: SCO family protein [Rhodocyclaceae bacterium]|nr:SCO family protein [Rhodocyclaceae bacterium]